MQLWSIRRIGRSSYEQLHKHVYKRNHIDMWYAYFGIWVSFDTKQIIVKLSEQVSFRQSYTNVRFVLEAYSNPHNANLVLLDHPTQTACSMRFLQLYMLLRTWWCCCLEVDRA